MIYIARVMARAQDLSGIEDISNKNTSPCADEQDADIIALSSISASQNNSNLHRDFIDQESVKSLEATPILSGAIPMAIFDGAMSQFAGDATLGGALYDIVVEFQDLPCARRILQHIIDYLLTAAPSDPTALICHIRQPLIGIQT